MKSRTHILLVICLALVGSSCGGIKNNKVEISGNKLNSKVGGVDVTVEIGKTEKERDEVTHQLEELKTQLAAKDALLAEERVQLLERQDALTGRLLALSEQLLTLNQQVASMRQNDAALRNEIGRIRAELKARSEETARLRKELAARAESEKSAPAPAKAEPEASGKSGESKGSEESGGSKDSAAGESPTSFALLINDTDSSLNFSVVAEDGSLEERSIMPGQRLVLEHAGNGVRIKFGAYRLWLDSVTRTGSRSAAPRVSELPGNHFDFGGDGRIGVFSEDEE